MEKEKWLVAVSGGPDSMALLHVLQQQDYELSVAHVNYHQRPESNDEEKMVKDYCLKHGLSFYSVDFDVVINGNFQHIARNFRYEFFSKLIKELDLKGVMVGHHYDDHIETYLIQKERGQRSDSIGLNINSFIKGVLVRRPLLQYSKDELIEVCLKNNIPYSVDSSNVDPKYTRNRIRLESKNLAKIEKAMRADRLAHKAVEDEVKAMVLKLQYSKVLYSEYSLFPSTIRKLYLRELLSHHKIEVFNYGEKFFSELDRQILNGKGIYRFGQNALFMEKDYFIISKKKEYSYKLYAVDKQVFPEFMFSNIGSENQKISFKETDFPITVRSTLPGDTIQMNFGRKKVSRYLIDRKIPHYQRENWLVIENAVKECIFVMGMGCDVHHYANNSTAFVVELNLL